MKLIDRILSVIFPPRCPCCGRMLGSDELCEECAKGIVDQAVTGKVCRYCGHEKRNCECRNYHYLFEGTVAPYYNRDTAQNGLYRFKFSDAPYAAEYFGIKMAQSFKKRFPDVAIDMVCIVPSHPKDLRKRKYEPVALLAKYCARELELPLWLKALKKVRHTEKQHELKHDKRQANVKGAFKASARLDGKTVLLVDDIKTTGYTLNECAKQLRMAGAEKVYCVTALITANKTCKSDGTAI